MTDNEFERLIDKLTELLDGIEELKKIMRESKETDADQLYRSNDVPKT